MSWPASSPTAHACTAMALLTRLLSLDCVCSLSCAGVRRLSIDLDAFLVRATRQDRRASERDMAGKMVLSGQDATSVFEWEEAQNDAVKVRAYAIWWLKRTRLVRTARAEQGAGTNET